MDRKEMIEYLERNASDKELEVINAFLVELRRAESLHPHWPDDMIHRVAIVNEEAGELVKAVLDHNEGKRFRHSVWEESIQTGAMCIRFAKNMEVVK